LTKPVWALIVAAGESTRMGCDKLRLMLAGAPVLVRTVRAFEGHERVAGVALVGPQDGCEAMQALLSAWGCRARVTAQGGATRQQSVLAGLKALPEGCAVLVHDGARPLVSAELIDACIDAVLTHGSGVSAAPQTDTLHRVQDDALITLPRDGVYAAQTPQAFERDALLAALERAGDSGFLATDEASVMAHEGMKVCFVPSTRRNMKITLPEDIALAEALLPAPLLRTGYGYDAHRLVTGRALMLCGVKVAYDKGLAGHSDADVAIHALIDALLGAMGMGDIGAMFPDTDERYRGASSLLLLQSAYEAINRRGGRCCAADITIVAQRPKLAEYRGAMTRSIASVLALPETRINVKFTTTEGMGFEGEGLGMSAHAVANVQWWDEA